MKLNAKILDLLERTKGREVIFWGASRFLEEFINKNDLHKYNIIGIIDKNRARQGETLGSYKIKAPEILDEHTSAYIIFSILNNNAYIYTPLKDFLRYKYPQVELAENIFENNNEQEDVIKLLRQYKAAATNQYTELLNAQIFNNLVADSTWIEKNDFIPLKSAATYSFLLILYLILDKIRPMNILEFGMGQTSKLTGAYAANLNKNSRLQIVEQNKEWMEVFTSQIPAAGNISIHHKNVTEIIINYSFNHKYEDLSDITGRTKYDLIIIDGPVAGKDMYPRTSILDLIPDNLAEDFIIILDDAERFGETNTAQLILNRLEENNIKYISWKRIASKTQQLITSPKYKFLKFY